MSKVSVNIALSLDGYMAPEGMTMDVPDAKRLRALETENAGLKKAARRGDAGQ